MDLSIIIVNYNSKDYLKKCIDSILANTSGISFEIIVVDSASYDGCGEMLRSRYPEVRFIQSTENIGFAKANNLGAGHAAGNTLLFLNPDTEMHEPAIITLYSHIQRLTDIGVAGCRLVNTDGSLQTSCVQPLPTISNQVLDAEIFQKWFPSLGIWTTAASFEGQTEPAEVEALSGACLMIRRDVFAQVGGFTEDYFMYGEDMDLCQKTRCAGLKNFYVSTAAIIHHGGGSSTNGSTGYSDVMMRESISLFLQRHRGDGYRACYRFALTAAAAFRLLLLPLLYPVWRSRGRSREWCAAKRKWAAILHWGLGTAKPAPLPKTANIS